LKPSSCARNIVSYPTNNSKFGLNEEILIFVTANDSDHDAINYSIYFDDAIVSDSNTTTYTLNESGQHKITFNVSDGKNSTEKEAIIYVIPRQK